jgi:hypothetical protein
VEKLLLSHLFRRLFGAFSRSSGVEKLLLKKAPRATLRLLKGALDQHGSTLIFALSSNKLASLTRKYGRARRTRLGSGFHKKAH